MKACKTCHKLKRLSGFHINKATRDGHAHECKACVCSRSRQHYERRSQDPLWFLKERIRNRVRSRTLRTAGMKRGTDKHVLRKYAAKYKAKYPERGKATTLINNSIRCGKLCRLPCEVCGSPKSDAHHDDYSKPLDVKWLCRRHHKELHSAIRDANLLAQVA